MGDRYYQPKLFVNNRLVASGPYFRSPLEYGWWFGDLNIRYPKGAKVKEIATVHDHEPTDGFCSCRSMLAFGPNLEHIRAQKADAVDRLLHYANQSGVELGLVRKPGGSTRGRKKDRSLMKCPECGDEEHVTSMLRHLNEAHPTQAWEHLESVSQALRIYEEDLTNEARERELQQEEE